MMFMQQVERDMASTLGLDPFDPSESNAPGRGWAGCYSCHTHRPGGQAE